ncbi:MULTISPECIES: hypothetical protein [Pedobacter]|uniref:hypothetical protein n=1 Tax=Pedobacter TaxID=84567 RepID=UPI002930A41A|nr:MULTISPECIES: hypothetical protein [Pedobacter]
MTNKTNVILIIILIACVGICKKKRPGRVKVGADLEQGKTENSNLLKPGLPYHSSYSQRNPVFFEEMHDSWVHVEWTDGEVGN